MIEWILSSSVLLAVVILLRQLLKGRISLRLQYALWGLVLLRLLIPVSIGSAAFSVANAVPADSRAMPDRGITSAQEYIRSGTAEREYALPVQHGEYVSAHTAPNPKDGTGELVSSGSLAERLQPAFVLRLLWIAGMIAAALCLFGSNLRFALRLKKTRKLLRMETLPVYLTAEADTPCLFGLFRPAIYVTAEAAEDEVRLRHVIRHELTHYRHGDQIWALLRGFCLILHWYNPLVWWGAFLSRRDAELACDEDTIRSLGEEERAAYGRTLICMTCTKRPALLVTATTMTGSKGGIRERIRLIARRPRMAFITLILVLLATAAAVGCTFTGAQTTEGASPSPAPTAENSSAPKPDATPTPAPSPAEPSDEWFLERAQAVIDDYLADTEISCLPVAGALRRRDDGSVEVNYGCLGLRYTLSVVFKRGEDGSWAQWPDNTVILNERVQERAELKLDPSLRNVPGPVADFALETAQKELDYYELTLGYVFDEARVTGITSIPTGVAGLNKATNLYLLEYRFLPNKDQEIIMAGGMTMENGWLTEWGSAGQPYLLMEVEDREDSQVWTDICTTNTDVITEEYGTPEMLENYGNQYTAAAMELRQKYMNRVDPASPMGFSVITETKDLEEIGRLWAESFIPQYLSLPEDHPRRCEEVSVLQCVLDSEYLNGRPGGRTLIYRMLFICRPSDENAFDQSFAGWAEKVTAEGHPQYAGWWSFGFYTVLQPRQNNCYECVETGSGGYGGWGYVNYGLKETLLYFFPLDSVTSDDYSDENYLMILPLIDWRSMDHQSPKIWDALWERLDRACLTEGRVYGQEDTRMWSDVYPDDQAYRDMYMILGFLNSDGAYAEGLATLLKKQYDYDSQTFECCLKYYLTEDQQRIVRLSIAGEGEKEALTATLHFYDGPTKEKTEPKGQRTVVLDGSDHGDAEKLKGLKTIIDGIRYWNDDYMVDRVEFWFDGDVEFSDKNRIFYFSYDQQEICFDHYFAQLSPKAVEYLKSIAEE